MAEMRFTEEQRQVIDARNQNLLVSAAAGSGKTAVLVERIIERITDRERPVDIDRLLVVTFTQAAAAEMRERISLAIEARLYEEPENEHLQRQAALLHNAQITTIDSFCLFVIRNNFNDIGLDPAFRVADEGEIRLMKQDVMEELLEDCFGAGGEDFRRLVEAFGKNGSEKPLAEQIKKLYDFSQSLPWPEQWLLACKKDYEIADLETFLQSDFVAELLRETALCLISCKEELEAALRVCEEPDGPYMYGEMLEQDLELVERLRQAVDTGLEESFVEMGKVSYPALSRKKDESVNVDKRERVKGMRDGVKGMIQGLRGSYFYKSPEKQLADMQKAEPMVAKLIDVTLEFAHRFAQKKREKNVIDFSDMEHMALQILVQTEDNAFKPTRAAEEYRKYFEELMVDEYQDSNLVQEALIESISGEPEGRYNRFMVGDVKQSIYRFRLARPELFLEKYEAYGKALMESKEDIDNQGDTDNQRDIEMQSPCHRRIDLTRNFRSRPEVLESTNYVFSRIMRRELGGVEYDAAAALYPGAMFPIAEEVATTSLTGEKQQNPYETELLLLDEATLSEEKPDSREWEARMIATQIKKLVGHFQVTDKQTGALRPASYRDIVILLRTNSGWDETFLRVLRGCGIPAYAASKTGYFAASEVQTLLQYLRILDNPRQDIPLYGVLKSVLGGFSEEELALVRATEKETKGGLYVQLEQFAKGTERPEHIVKKWRTFHERLVKYRKMVCYTPVGRLIREILKDSGYLYAMAAMPGGEQRQANVEMLLARAGDFERTSYYGLFHFLRYMEQLEKYQIDYGEASILDENADTVRLMSIHKSKGLEFPICFVAGLSKAFNRMDARETVLLDVDGGLGAEYVNLEQRYRQNTLQKNVLRARLKRESLGEELRILYVAMTRAREKLFLTSSVKDAEKLKASCPGLGADGQRMSYGKLLSAGSFLDLLLPCVQNEQNVIHMTVVSEDMLTMSQLEHDIHLSMREKKWMLEQDNALSGKEEALRKQLAFQYPHENLRELYTKTTVSELKKAGHEDNYAGADELYKDVTESARQDCEQIVPILPHFLQETETVSGTDRGSAYHRVMELLSFADVLEKEKDRWESEIQRQLAQMEEQGRLSTVYRESVRIARIIRFLESTLAGRMANAQKEGKLYKEKPFVLGISAARLGKDFPEKESVLVQGIIDVWFEEDGEIVVADYKTDRIERPEELKERYAVQLDYYAEALERITGKRVKERILYSFALQEEIPV